MNGRRFAVVEDVDLAMALPVSCGVEMGAGAGHEPVGVGFPFDPGEELGCDSPSLGGRELRAFPGGGRGVSELCHLAAPFFPEMR